LTHSGQIALKTLNEARKKISIVPEYKDVLRHLPLSLDIDYDIFSSGTVTRPSRSLPIKPVEDLQKLVSKSRHIRGFSPVILPQYVNVFHGKICKGVNVELILERTVIEELESSYPDKLEDSISKENFTLRETSEGLHLGLILVDEVFGLMIYNKQGKMKAFVEVKDGECLEWGKSLYREIKGGPEVYSSRKEKNDIT